ncbi:hypothetical protein C8J56DRAFT_1029491 [Mycena floridula]|nr:hypothetical protein C8J56DRAFT_1029491 [Mycena floridula]
MEEHGSHMGPAVLEGPEPDPSWATKQPKQNSPSAKQPRKALRLITPPEAAIPATLGRLDPITRIVAPIPSSPVSSSSTAQDPRSKKARVRSEVSDTDSEDAPPLFERKRLLAPSAAPSPRPLPRRLARILTPPPSKRYRNFKKTRSDLNNNATSMVDALNRSFNSPPNSRSSSGSDGGATSIADALNQSFNGSNSSRSSPATPPRSQEHVDAMMVDQASTSSGSAPGTLSKYSSNVKDQCPSSSRSSSAAPTRSNVNDGATTMPVDQSFGDSSDPGSSPVPPSQEISSGRDLLLRLRAEVAELQRINTARTEAELIRTKEQLKEVMNQRDQLKLAQSLSNRVGVDINFQMVPEESGQLLERFRYRPSHAKHTRGSMNRPHHQPYPLPSSLYYRNTAPGYPNNKGSPKYGGLRSYERQSVRFPLVTETPNSVMRRKVGQSYGTERCFRKGL